MNANDDTKNEVVLHGLAASPGVAVGPVFLVVADDDYFVERDIAAADVPAELARFERALDLTRTQLRKKRDDLDTALGSGAAAIFDAHLLLVDDEAWSGEVIAAIRSHQKNAEATMRAVADKYAAVFAKMDDPYLRERTADVKDVARRILRNLSGKHDDHGAAASGGKENRIIVAPDLGPSDATTLQHDNILGFATDLGALTSHAAILARAYEVPAVVGLHDVSARVQADDTVLVDGHKGMVIVNPSERTLAEYSKFIEEIRSLRTGLAELKDLPPETTDGFRVILSANIESVEELDAIHQHGATGVGLFRSEYLYSAQIEPPDEFEQAESYTRVARDLDPESVTIRTLDLGGDKALSNLEMPAEDNPFMGWRAIRFCLARPKIFKAQLRAILRASHYGHVKIMYPMISNVDEVVRANLLLDEAKDELRAQAVPFNDAIEVGCMIEIPAAALSVDALAKHCDFFSLGTNDLLQYTLAIDRVNERVAYLYEPTHPAIIKLMKTTIDAGHRHGLWVSICGEMAGDPFLVPLLIGMGLDEFSVNPAAVPMVKDVIRKLSYTQALELAEEALTMDVGADIVARCRELTREIAPEILELVE